MLLSKVTSSGGETVCLCHLKNDIKKKSSLSWYCGKIKWIGIQSSKVFPSFTNQTLFFYDPPARHWSLKESKLEIIEAVKW